MTAGEHAGGQPNPSTRAEETECTHRLWLIRGVYRQLAAPKPAAYQANLAAQPRGRGPVLLIFYIVKISREDRWR
jgi:hypothetical protein